MDIMSQGQGHDVPSCLRKESSSSIGKADMLQLRHWLVEMVEELKVKRKVVVAAEARAELLAEQLFSLQVQKDSQEQAAKQREDKLEQSMALMKQECEDQLKAMSVKEIQHKAQTESHAYVQEKIRTETRQLKASIRQKEKQLRELETQLQTEKSASSKLFTQWKETEASIRQKEKQLRELETQLQTEKSASSKLFTQWKETEVKFEELAQLHQVCQRSVSRLEEAVSVACDTNRKLSRKQEQHSSAMREKTRQVEELEAELVKARVQISERPLEAIDVQRAQASIDALNKQVLQLEKDKADLEEQLHQDWDRRKKVLAQLETAQALVGKHLDNATKNRQEADKYRLQCCDLIGQRDHVTQQLADTARQLQERQEEYTRGREQWGKEKSELEESLATKTHMLDMIQKHKVQLEDQNMEIMEAKEKLQAALADAKAKLEVPKTESSIQAGCSLNQVFEASVQVRVDSITVSTQTPPPPGVRVAFSQTELVRRVTKMSQTVSPECTVTLGTQTTSLPVVHVGTSPALIDSHQYHRHVGLQTDVFGDNVQITESLWTASHTHSKDNQNSLCCFQRNSFSSKVKHFQSDSSHKIEEEAKNDIWTANEKFIRSKSNFHNTQPLDFDMEDHHLSQDQFSTSSPSIIAGIEKQTNANKTISEKSIWQQMSPLQSALPDTQISEGAVEKAKGHNQAPEKLGSTRNEISIKQEYEDDNETSPPSFLYPTSKTLKSSNRSHQNASRSKRVPKYPHLLFADPQTSEDITDKIEAPTNTNCTRSNSMSTLEKPTQSIHSTSDTNNRSVELYLSDLTQVQRSRWNVYSKQHKETFSSKQNLDEFDANLGAYSAVASNTMNTSNQNDSHVVSPNHETSAQLNKGIKIEHTDYHRSANVVSGENTSLYSREHTGDESYNITSFSSPLTNHAYDVRVQGSNKKDTHADKSPRRKKVFKSLCLSKTSTVPTTDVDTNSSLHTKSHKSMTGSSEESHNTEGFIATDSNQTTDTKIDQQEQDTPCQLKETHNSHERQYLSKDVSTKDAEFDKMSTDIRNKDTQVDKLRPKDFHPDKPTGKSDAPTMDQSVVSTSPSTTTNRSIFKSSTQRPSLQETISAFKSSPRSRHLLGAPVSKTSNPKSRFVAKVSPLHHAADGDRSKQRKDGRVPVCRAAETGRNPQARKHDVVHRQSKGSNSGGEEGRGGRKQSPLFPPNITKLYGYGAQKAEGSAQSSIAPKGILKAPGSSLHAKSVHFPAQLEMHMKGLTQESQDSVMTSQTQAIEPAVSSMFEPNSSAIPSSEGLHHDLHPVRQLQTQDSTNDYSTTAHDKESQPNDNARNAPTNEVFKKSDSTIDSTISNNAKSKSHNGPLEINEKDKDNSIIDPLQTELNPNFPTNVKTCLELTIQRTCTRKDERPLVTETKGTISSGDHLASSALPSAQERPSLVIPETPNLSAVVERSSIADQVSDFCTEQDDNMDQTSTSPPDCKKLKLGSP